MTLDDPMDDGKARLVAVAGEHREKLRGVCASDPELWQIYSISMLGEAFDPAFNQMLSDPRRTPFVAFRGDELVGMSSYYPVERTDRTIEIGGTFFIPHVRGTGFNQRVKRLMLDRAFGCGFTRVEFRIDTRNTRSMAAVEKLGARRDGILRKNRVTWTGFVRDTAVYSILADEWLSTAG